MNLYAALEIVATEKKKAQYDEDEDFVLSSDGGLIDSGSEKAYDSDDDPGWEPTVDVSCTATPAVARHHSVQFPRAAFNSADPTDVVICIAR